VGTGAGAPSGASTSSSLGAVSSSTVRSLMGGGLRPCGAAWQHMLGSVRGVLETKFGSMRGV